MLVHVEYTDLAPACLPRCCFEAQATVVVGSNEASRIAYSTETRGGGRGKPFPVFFLALLLATFYTKELTVHCTIGLA